jgi:EAL domain-containing protein (putative c-di-GMP-specific phosphodiesterase class I)
MTASAGIAMYPADGNDYAALLRGADAAMYLAKQAGRNTARFFAEESQERARERLDVLAQLRGAAARGELVLHYQPQVSLTTGEIVGAEALVRWEHPSRGLLGPGAFIPIAEDGDLIVEVGEWVMRTAVAQMRAWIDAGFLQDGQITVNVSARHMQRQAFAPWVQHVLDGVGLPPRHLVLELTETAAMSQPEIAIRAIEQLARIGVGVALDDFGTGYSSMAYLRQFDIATIKIDKSLIDDVGRVEDASAIVAAIIQLARTLGYQTLAEGVETQTQWDFLRQHDCDQMQGFFVSPGVPAEEFLALVRHPPIPLTAE